MMACDVRVMSSFGAFDAGGSFVDEVVVTLFEIGDRPGQIEGCQCCWTDTVGLRFSFPTSQYLHIHQKCKVAFAELTHIFRHSPLKMASKGQ
jgi:hypothetical protein